LAFLAPAFLALALLAQGVRAETVASAPAPTPEQVRSLLTLLADPAVQAWLERQSEAPGTALPPSGPGVSDGMTAMEEMVGDPASYLDSALASARNRLKESLTAAPRLPEELARVWTTLSGELRGGGVLWALTLVLAFIGLSFGVEWLFWRAAARIRAQIGDLDLGSVRDRLRAVLMRFAFGVALVAAFAAGSVGAFLLLGWPMLLREIVVGYLFAFLMLRVALVVGRFLLAPGSPRFRIVPMTTEQARFWFRWTGIILGWFAFGWVTISLLRTLGFELHARRLVADALLLIQLALLLTVLWIRPLVRQGAARERSRAYLRSGLLSGWFVLLWLLLAAGAFALFWTLVVAVTLPAMLHAMRRAVGHILQPEEEGSGKPEAANLHAVCLERGVRALLVIVGVYLLGWAWGIDLDMLTAGDKPAVRLLRGALNAIVILLLADFSWHATKAWIDQRLLAAEPAEPGPHAATEEARRRARLRTLLPILRNVLFVVFIVLAGLMALSALGVQIGPLLAGAGVVGVAVGFGAQTLVKDIISGMFYLLDDAFRVGEYITSGSYKGTVESFSLRSVKLRHHRGPLTTVPFGELGAVQNLSRDWVIDKIQVGVTYDTDLDKVKRIIKQVSKEIMADPELAPNILEPLKSQGVYAMGDFAIQIRMKIMTRPGEQFVVRRSIYSKIKKAFDANGIRFAFPTVTVAGTEPPGVSPAIAQQALELARPPTAAD
jgi:small-conductance mechanosensitive channel